MSSCSCSPESLARLTFANGTVLLRCAAHEAQHWLVDGRPVAVPVALDGLRRLFVERRGARGPAVHQQQRMRQQPPVHPPRSSRDAGPAQGPARDEHVIQLPRTPPPLSPNATDGEALTALLNARGLSGSWAVA